MRMQNLTRTQNRRHIFWPATALLMLALCLSAHSFSQDKRAPNWMIATVSGQNISLEEELKKGNKVVVIFWATWCSHCRKLLPEISHLQTTLDTTIRSTSRFVAMNIWEDGNPIHYVNNNGITLPIALKAESIAKKYEVRSTPGVFVIGKGNRILYQRTAGESPSTVIDKIKGALLNSP